MKRSGSWQKAAGLLALVGALALAACGSSSKGGGTTAGVSDPNAILRVGRDFQAGALGPSFDPGAYNSSPSYNVNLQFDTLLYQTPDGLKPGLAEKWAFPDASTIDITLRKNLKFQDGTALDAAALKFSWDRIIATPASASGAANGSMTKVAGVAAMQSTEIVNGDTVRLHLKSPVAGDFRDRYLFEATSGLSPVSPTAVAKAGAGLRSGVPSDAGAGPYKLTEYIPGQKISVRKWDGYWNPAGQKLGGIDFFQVAAGAPATTALTSGTVDLIQPAGADAKALLAQGFSVTPYINSINADWLTFCPSNAPIDKLAVRQAIAYALNRKDFVDTAYFGYAEGTGSFLASTSPFYDKNFKEFYPQDIAKAKSLLAGAGVAAGTHLTYITGSRPEDTAFAQVFQSQLQAIGITLDITQSATAFADLSLKKWSIQHTAAIRTAVSAYITTGGVGNPCGYDDPKVTAALNGTRDTSANQAQLTAAWQAFDKAAADQVALIPVAKPAQITATSKKVQGITDKWGFQEFWPGAVANISMSK